VRCSAVTSTAYGATGYTDAEAAEQMLQVAGLATSLRQELDGAWSVRFGPLPRTAPKLRVKANGACAVAASGATPT
jgi:hypothetical protein